MDWIMKKATMAEDPSLMMVFLGHSDKGEDADVLCILKAHIQGGGAVFCHRVE
jgi:hypothetical protein